MMYGSESHRGFFFFISEASDIMKNIGEAIQYLHSVNIAHRDVKVCAIYKVQTFPCTLLFIS